MERFSVRSKVRLRRHFESPTALLNIQRYKASARTMIQKDFWLVPERTPCAPVRRRATARLTDWIKPKVKSIKGGLVGAKEMEK